VIINIHVLICVFIATCTTCLGGCNSQSNAESSDRKIKVDLGEIHLRDKISTRIEFPNPFSDSELQVSRLHANVHYQVPW